MTTFRSSALIAPDLAHQSLAFALCRRFATEGISCRVIAATELPELTAALASDRGPAASNARLLRVDPGDAAALESLLDALEREGERPLLGFFTVAATPARSLLELDPAELEAVWRSSCRAGLVFAQTLIRRMLVAKRGSLLLASPRASPVGGSDAFGPSMPAAAGLRALGQTMARTFGAKGLHVAHLALDSSCSQDAGTAVAEAAWWLHAQHRTAWTQELDVYSPPARDVDAYVERR